MVFETKHAIGLIRDDVEMLIHIGLETVSLEGKYFEAKIKAGDRIKKGDLLIEFDLEAISRAGFDTLTPVIISNADDFAEIEAERTSGAVGLGLRRQGTQCMRCPDGRRTWGSPPDYGYGAGGRTLSES